MNAISLTPRCAFIVGGILIPIGDNPFRPMDCSSVAPCLAGGNGFTLFLRHAVSLPGWPSVAFRCGLLQHGAEARYIGLWQRGVGITFANRPLAVDPTVFCSRGPGRRESGVRFPSVETRFG